jgi:two-component system cell cycle response regulator DivK
LALIADDDHATAKSLARLLELWGFAVEVVHDGRHALQRLLDQEPPLAIIDLHMPDMMGHDVARAARANGLGSKLIAHTGHDDPALRESTAAAGFDAFFPKPIDSEALLAFIRQVLPQGAISGAGST